MPIDENWTRPTLNRNFDEFKLGLNDFYERGYHTWVHPGEPRIIPLPIVDDTNDMINVLNDVQAILARPEGCIAEAYTAEEALTLCSRYLRNVPTRFNRPDKNDDGPPPTSELEVFRSACTPKSAGVGKKLDHEVKKKLVWYVLDNSPEIDKYKIECRLAMPENDLPTKFSSWFRDKVVQDANHQKIWDTDVIVDADVVHDSNSFDVALTAILDDLEYTRLSGAGHQWKSKNKMLKLRASQEGLAEKMTDDEIMDNVLGSSRAFKPGRGRKLSNSASSSFVCSYPAPPQSAPQPALRRFMEAHNE
nr:hypothetical protein [Tanacetum cinerariifolium]